MSARFLITFLILFAFATAFASDPSLIGYWNFNEGSGTTIHDLSSNANHGSVGEGAFSWVPGVSGHALFLDSGRVSFGIPNNLSPANAITLEAWYKPVSFDGTGNDAIIDRGYTEHEVPAYQFHLGVCGDQYEPPGASHRAQFLFALGVNNDYNVIRTPAGFWAPDNWYHIVGTYDGVMQKLYVNGVLIDQKSLTGPIPDYGNTMFFGGFSNLVYRLPGTIDEIRIYSRALSADEIVQHYNLEDFANFIIRIEKTHNTLQGSYVEVPIFKSYGTLDMGGFDFLIAYDASALSLTSVEPGAALGPSGCGWEYFTYRYGPQGNCGGPCPSGLLRVVAIADANNGPNHPDCYTVNDGETLAVMKFLVTNDRNYECQYVPIRFAWIDCGDNGISSRTGDTLFISSRVFEFENTDPFSNPDFEITDTVCYFAVAYGGACSMCDVMLKYEPIRSVIYWNGGVDIVCADSIDDPGDLNLNGLANEIADAVLYTNYFMHGVAALDVVPPRREAQVAASDINRDGVPLTVGDLVYLLRIIVGDALPIPKLAPIAGECEINWAHNTFTTSSANEIGGVYATFKVNGDYALKLNTDMETVSAESEGLLKILVYAGLTNISNRVAAGANNLFSIDGNVELVTVEVSDYQGNMMNAKVNQDVLPANFVLSQNVPNPFNPTTKIGMNLPTATDWSLDIYNVSGQLVKSFSGRGVGNVSVEWDAANQPSGVYFYRLVAGSFSDSRKMLLLK